MIKIILGDSFSSQSARLRACCEILALVVFAAGIACTGSVPVHLPAKFHRPSYSSSNSARQTLRGGGGPGTAPTQSGTTEGMALVHEQGKIVSELKCDIKVVSQWIKLAEEQGEKVRKLKEDMKADPASHTKDELGEALAKLKELKAKADDPMNVLEDPITKGKYDLVRSICEECVTDGELAMLMARKPDSFILYDGFEPSGRMHIAQGIFKAMNVNKCTRAGGMFVFWVADWFALMNDKMGGDLEKIKTVGKYLVEVWKASGMDMERVKFIWSSDAISKNAEAYWTQALDYYINLYTAN